MRLIDADELLKKAIATDDYFIDGDTYWDYVVYQNDILDAPTIDAIPISFITTVLLRKEKEIDYEIYESDEPSWMPIYKRDALVELIREWKRENS